MTPRVKAIDASRPPSFSLAIFSFLLRLLGASAGLCALRIRLPVGSILGRVLLFLLGLGLVNGCGHGPLVPEWIQNLSEPIPPKLILHRLGESGASGYGLLDCCVNVWDLNVEGNSGALEGVRVPVLLGATCRCSSPH